MKNALLVLLFFLIGLVVYKFIQSNHNTTTGEPLLSRETAFERVIRTNTLRCGYAVATPWFYVDPQGQKAGLSYDVAMAVAEKMGVNIEWTEETGWGVAEQGLITGRYDALCANVCIDAHRIRAASYATPFVHIPLFAIVRADDHQFDDMTHIDTPNTRIGVKSNHVFEYTAKERFPQAQRVYLNDISDDTEFLTMLANRKIDVAFTGQSTLDLYNKNNEAKLRALPTPVRYCHGAFMIPSGDYQLREMVDAAQLQLLSGGQLERITSKHMPLDPRYIKLPAPPYAP